jgi:hypothetical protein
MPLLSKLRSHLPIPEAVAIAMLAWALFPDHAYAKFVLLHWVACAVFIWLAVRAYGQHIPSWCWVPAPPQPFTTRLCRRTSTASFGRV